MVLKSKGFIAGKEIFVHAGGKRCTVAELKQFMRRFSTTSVLRGLGTVYRHIWESGGKILVAGDMPVPPHSIQYLALVSIEVANDHRALTFDDAGFQKAVRMFNNLVEPLTEQTGKGEAAGVAHLLRLGQHDFHHQAEMRHLMPRTVLMLRDVWLSTPEAAGVDPLADLYSIAGLTLEQIIWAGQVCAALPDEGYVRPSSFRSAKPDDRLSAVLTEEVSGRFFKWASATYKTIRGEAAKYRPPQESYDKYRFNPLAVYPLVRPDVNPDPRNGPVYLVPCRRLVLERTTQGLYHDLVKHHMTGPGANAFKAAFGYVFQNYVGLLLRRALRSDSVHAEWKYGPSSAVRATPDWIVIEGHRAVLVEVKQSGLFLGTKMWGELATLRSDMKKTLGEAALQLASFDTALASATPGLERLREVTDYERLVVTFDSVHWGNSIIREELAAIGAEQSGGPPGHVHVAAIHEFEYVLGRCWNGSLFDLLRDKRTGEGGQDAMDFKDWMGHRPVEGKKHGNPFLSETFNELNAAVGLPPVSGATAQAALGGAGK